MSIIQRRQFDEPYRTVEVVAGGHAIVWDERFTRDEPGFIDKIAVDWYAGTYYDWFVDNVRIEKIQRTIQMTEPDEYDPPIIARKRIRWIFYNNSLNTFDAGVLCSGYRARKTA